ncbi:MAG: T9SS type A sorting domain-containing protein [Bacteroidales bacterium]|nr:T9SS type A sorting domain-containing protein [Bacteroidales bacterium]
MMEEQNKIEIFVSNDNQTQLFVKFTNDTVWLDAHTMALLFEVQRPAIVKHINNIYKTNELEKSATCSILEQLAKGQRAMYSFYDIALNEIRYKESWIGNNSVRLAHFENRALISPNPATDYIQLNLGQEIEIAKIVIYDASGRIVLEDNYFELNSRIQTDNFEQGVYFIRITAESYNKTSKFIIL